MLSGKLHENGGSTQPILLFCSVLRFSYNPICMSRFVRPKQRDAPVFSQKPTANLNLSFQTSVLPFCNNLFYCYLYTPYYMLIHKDITVWKTKV